MILSGKRVLLTGGTGSLGKAILARAEREQWNTEFVIFSRDETKQAHVKNKYPRYQYILGDVAKYRDVKRAMQNIDTVIHLAAYKQVPSAQNNVPATIETNIIGSQNIADVAIEEGVAHVVATSTDKACQPANLYGVSKAAMESIFQHANKAEVAQFHLTRYGNVISSSESVIPFFRQQRAKGQALTVTNRTMTRFWLTLNQSIDLILSALGYDPGVIVVPKAPAMSVWHLAELLANEGPMPSEVVETSIRPGEKIHEAMVESAESFHTRELANHFLIYPPTGKYYNSEAPFTYTSDKAPTLTDEQFWIMLKETEELYG